MSRSKEVEVVGVRHSGPNNSTAFTECCGTAICDNQSRCPSCKKLVIGHDCETEHETGLARFRYAYRRG
jgi:hypothetical protein